MRKINWGILGTSPISEVMAHAIRESKFSELKAIGSRSSEKGQVFANKFSTQCYSDYNSLLNDPEIDALYIGLPNHLHKEWVIRCAQAGKHILCEKPFALTAEEAHEAFSAAKNANVFCMEALMYRYHPFTKKLTETIQNKTIGDIQLINATYTAHIADVANPTAGGSIRNLGCYPISLIRLLFNAEPIGLTALGRLCKKTQNDNQASAILKFANHAMAVVTTADDIKMSWHFDIYGTEGSLKLLTNPWLPNQTHNKMIVQRYEEKNPHELNVTAEQSLYTYQIDALSQRILQTSSAELGISPEDSIGNISVLEDWLQQVKVA